MDWLNVIVVFVCILFGLFLYRTLCPRQKEYFTQKSPFILRQNNEVYDPFYLEYYDDLHATKSYCDADFLFIKESTNPTTQKSTFLDIGCGTGILLQRLKENGFAAVGVDKSKHMEEACRKSSLEVKCDDVLLDPMLYENKTFSHITCTHFTIYEMENKETLLRHCFNWLKCGGFLILHLVDPDSFKKVLASLYHNSALSTMVTKSNLEYNNFTYRGEFKPGSIFSETFTDKFTENVRQNQMTLFMEPKQTILDKAMKCGFVIHGEMVYTLDPHQFLVVLVKPMCGEY